MSRDYWAERDADAQNRITDKGIEKTNAQMRKYYKSAMDRVIRDFEATLDKLNAAAAEGMQPTPADLYKLDKYWQMQGQLRQELRKLGEKENALLTKNFELNYFEVYHSINIEGLTAFNTIDKAAVHQMINSSWLSDGKTFSQRIWNNTDRLVETLNEKLIECVATGKKTTELKNLLQERFLVSYNKAD